ncbi:hypothetical protein TNCV_2026151 [Trichonephila clavipes]|nr:hypothetical protein TNCV_2026151 [Trichonephila clavipes]
MPDIKIDDNGLFEVERRLNVCLNSNKLEQLENQHVKEFSVKFSQFKKLSETLKFLMYPDVTLFDKLNLPEFDWLKIEEFEMQLIDF